MTNLKSIIATGILGGSLVLSGCGNKEKYENFANFIAKEGSLGSDEDRRLNFLKDNKEYFASLYSNALGTNEEVIVISILDQKSYEHFQDWNLNGLNNYTYEFENRKKVKDPSSTFFQSKENKQKYEMLIDSIPKWYAESKKGEKNIK